MVDWYQREMLAIALYESNCRGGFVGNAFGPQIGEPWHKLKPKDRDKWREEARALYEREKG